MYIMFNFILGSAGLSGAIAELTFASSFWHPSINQPLFGPL
jgi:hypothetical protein